MLSKFTIESPSDQNPSYEEADRKTTARDLQSAASGFHNPVTSTDFSDRLNYLKFS